MSDDRPTLEQQIRLSKMTDEELAGLFRPHGLLDYLDFFIFNRCNAMWSLLHWNWFCIWCGKSHLGHGKCLKAEGKEER